ncbi:MAG TPA: hypothetical protein VD906_09320, partial [Caulobacteraceae bacterium]|nr:hypothetical protein [Caulobacteraceae bacterium]
AFFCERYFRASFPGRYSPGSAVPAGALFALATYGLWLLTPAYNLLANASAALVFAGVLGWATYPPQLSRGLDRFASLLVGMGGAYAFFAKPTFALLAGLAAGVVLLGGSKRSGWPRVLERAAIAGLSCVLLTWLHIVTVTPLHAFIATISAGLEVLNFGNSLTTLPIKTVRELAHAPAVLFAAGGLLLICLVRSEAAGARERTALRVIAGLLGAASVALFFHASFAALRSSSGIIGTAIGPYAVSVVLAQLSYAVLGARLDRASLIRLTPILLLLALPFAIAFGTVNNIVRQTGLSLFAVFLASLFAARLLSLPRTAAIFQAALSASVILLVALGALAPYGLAEPIHRQRSQVEAPFTGDRLFVDQATGRYIAELQRVSKAAGISPQTPVVDLSGPGPGTVLFLGGRPPAFPWVVPNYANSEGLADAVWQSMSEAEREQAWIVGPISPKFLDSRLVAELRQRPKALRCVAVLPHTFRQKQLEISLWAPAKAASRLQPSSACAGLDLAPA